MILLLRWIKIFFDDIIKNKKIWFYYWGILLLLKNFINNFKWLNYNKFVEYINLASKENYNLIIDYNLSENMLILNNEPDL